MEILQLCERVKWTGGWRIIPRQPPERWREVDAEGIDNIADRRLYADLLFADLEAIVAKEGKEFDCDLYCSYITFPQSRRL